jgi:formylglycine-generating enzyme required for sulfatase activity/energy-coupling factor transporter ATP-binding protein EcfA2
MTSPKNIGSIKSERDVILGNQTNITQVIQMPAFQPPPDLEQLRADYLAHLRRSYHALDFKGIPQLRTLSREMALEDVYVPLLARPELPAGETWERQRLAGRNFDQNALPEEALAGMTRQEASPPIHVEEALRQKSRLVVLGDPGSGKSTLLKHLALRLAEEDEAALPILVPLNAYARALTRHDGNLHNFLAEYFAGRAQGVAALGPLFDHAIAHGQAVILLDGLDEVQSERAALVGKVQDFAHEAVRDGNKVIVTSRIVGYRDAPLAVNNWALYTLLDFDSQAIEDFAARWCLAFEKSTLGNTPEARLAAETERRGLLDAIEANRGVARLASNPLLLTILALIKRQRVELPRSRIKLYDCYLETLIEAWNKARALDKTSAGNSLEYEATLDILGPLALRLRQENPTAGLVSERELLAWLTECYTGEQWGLKPGPARQQAIQFLHEVRQYSNLLLERGEGQFGFIHLTFEEALAAYGLVSAGQMDHQRSLAIIQAHLTDPAWRETILLAVGIWGLLNPRQPLVAGKMVRAMLEITCDGENACQNVLLAGACLEDVGELGLGRAAASEVIAALQAAALNRQIPPVTQRDAGFALGRLADSSPAFLAAICPDLDKGFVSIEAGKFRYGGDDFPERDETITHPFAIAKYPVTNLQYRRFVDAGGYDQQEFWSADGWAWRTGTYDSKAKEDYEKQWLARRPKEQRNEPFFWHDRMRNNPLAPVVGVSWFEAEAYGNWLTKTKADGKVYRLPTEEEWERAARGKDGREYAWGNDFDRDKLNVAAFWNRDDGENYLKDYDTASTTLVSQFPQGNTPDGICDLSGNVWEWTNSWHETDQINRTVRGGSFDGYRRFVRSAYRLRIVPDFFLNNVGFRVLSLASSGC